MISGVPLFRGRDNQDQLVHIMRIVGTPDERTLRRIATDSVGLIPYHNTALTTEIALGNFYQPEIVLKVYPKYPKIPFQQIIPKASPQGI